MRCIICGAEFKDKSNKKTCSNKCRATLYRNKNNPNRRRNIVGSTPEEKRERRNAYLRARYHKLKEVNASGN